MGLSQWSNNLQHEESVILRQLLIDGGVGGDAALTPNVTWPVYATNEPSTPDNCISLWDTTGVVQARSMLDGMLIQKAGFQVRIRATDSLTGRLKARAIETFMAENVYQTEVNLPDQQGNVWTYVVWAIVNIGSVLAIGLDKPNTQRSLFTVNAMAVILVKPLPPPPAPVAAFSSSPANGDAPLIVNFSDLSRFAPTSWHWDFGGLGSSDLENPSFTFIYAGNWDITLIVNNAHGSDTVSGSIVVSSPTVADGYVAWLSPASAKSQDTIGTVPATLDGDPVARVNDVSTNHNDFLSAANATSFMAIDTLLGGVCQSIYTTSALSNSTLSFDTQNFSAFFVIDLAILRPSHFTLFIDPVAGKLHYLFQDLTNNYVGLLFNGETGSTSGRLAVTDSSDTYTSNLHLPTSKALVGVIGRSTGTDLIVNGQTQTLPVLQLDTVAGLEILLTPNDLHDQTCGTLIDFLLYNTALNSTQLNQVRNWAQSVGAVFTAANILIFEGDSITAGGGASENRSWNLLLPYTTQFIQYNLSQPGLQMETIANDERAIDLFTPGATNICVVFAGTNDCAATLDHFYDVHHFLATYCASLRNVGFRVIVVNMLPRTGQTGGGNSGTLIESVRVPYNTAIAKSWTFYADLLADVTTLAMGQPGANTDLIWFADGVHPTPAGHAVLEALIEPLINSLMSVPTVFGPNIVCLETFPYGDGEGIGGVLASIGTAWSFGGGDNSQFQRIIVEDGKGTFSTVAQNEYSLYQDVGQKNVTIMVDVLIAVAGGNAGIVFRLTNINYYFTSNANFWFADINLTTGTVEIVEVVNWSETIRASASFAATIGVTYTLKVVVNGTTATLHVDGVQKCQYTTMASGLTQTQHGFYVGPKTNNAGSFNNFIVTSP